MTVAEPDCLPSVRKVKRRSCPSQFIGHGRAILPPRTISNWRYRPQIASGCVRWMDLLPRELLKISRCVVFFAAAFQSEGVRFDEEAGSFTTHTAFHSEIALRALERRGYRVQDGRSPSRTRVRLSCAEDSIV